MRTAASFALRIISYLLQRRRPQQEPWEGVPPVYRQLPIGRLPVPASLTEWNRQRDEVRSIVLKSLGDLPPRPSPLKVWTVAVDKKQGYRIEKFVFDNGLDSQVPGYIAIPEGEPRRYPAVLTMHGHGSSKDSMFGYRRSAQNVAERLVRRGYVVLGVDGCFHGERTGTGPAGDLESIAPMQEISLFKLNLWMGRTLFGMMLRDQQIALDYLASRPEVDANRIGAQGMSMGSTLAWWLGAIDERIKALVGVACLTRYEDLVAARELSAHGVYYFVPGILKDFDSEGVLALLAPRPFLALTGDRDRGSPVEGIVKLEQILSRFYALYGRPQAFRSVIFPKTGHVYSEEMKQQMVAWFDEFL